MPQTKPIVRVENVVASADQKIDLNIITQTFSDPSRRKRTNDLSKLKVYKTLVDTHLLFNSG